MRCQVESVLLVGWVSWVSNVVSWYLGCLGYLKGGILGMLGIRVSNVVSWVSNDLRSAGKFESCPARFLRLLLRPKQSAEGRRRLPLVSSGLPKAEGRRSGPKAEGRRMLQRVVNNLKYCEAPLVSSGLQGRRPPKWPKGRRPPLVYEVGPKAEGRRMLRTRPKAASGLLWSTKGYRPPKCPTISGL